MRRNMPGLFGYVGNQDDQAYIKDVALLDCYVTGQQNVGALAGVNYGTDYRLCCHRRGKVPWICPTRTPQAASAAS